MTIRDQLNQLYLKTLGKIVPQYAILSLIFVFSFNGMVYWGVQYFMKDASRYDFTSSIDRNVPFVKEWVVIYLVCYAFWAYNYILVAREEKEVWYRFAAADIVAKIICGIFFVLLPTTNIRPDVIGNDIFSQLMRKVYEMDPASNLFPSIHCLVSWFCYIGIKNSKKVSKSYKVFSWFFALMVFASTQYTKQHYLIDIAGALIIAEATFYVSNHTNFYLIFTRVFEKCNQVLFGKVEHV